MKTADPGQEAAVVESDAISFDADPTSCRHWRLDLDPPVATHTMQVSPDAVCRGGYQLKLNSYDLGALLRT